jgi:FkbM family methyltransferase
MMYKSAFRMLRPAHGSLAALRMLYDYARGRPLRIELEGGTYWLNHEVGAFYQLAYSLDKLKNLVAAIPRPSCRTILDVGANCGLFSVFAAHRYPGAEIIAFEPAPEPAAVAERNLARHGVKVLHQAVGRSVGTSRLFVNPESQVTNSLVRSAVEVFTGEPQALEVETIDLDSFCRAEGIERIDVLKIDVQGSETEVLAGAVDTLQRTDFLLLEVSFLDPDVDRLFGEVRETFPYWKPVNPVHFGADVLFAREPLDMTPDPGR